MLERLQKIIARAGISSRRRAEDLIVTGQVVVNGTIRSELGAKADPEHDQIRVAGKLLRMPRRTITLALNKPDACVSALSDPSGRATLQAFLGGVAGRVFPVGRLEYHATGLILLTSDGALAARLFRAMGRGLPQTYRLKIKNALSASQMGEISRKISQVRVWRPGANPWYEVRLVGAKQDRLRNLLFAMGHPVEKLRRVGIGPIELGDLETGRWRELRPQELRSLDQALGKIEERAQPPARKRRGKRAQGGERPGKSGSP